MTMYILRTAALRTAFKPNTFKPTTLKPGVQFIRPFSVAQPRFSGENVVEATEDTFDQLVINANNPVIADFYAEWCGPCKMIKSGMEKSAASHPNITLVMVNIDQCPGSASKSNITGIPTVKAYNKGEVDAYFVGPKSDADIEEFFAEHDARTSS